MAVFKIINGNLYFDKTSSVDVMRFDKNNISVFFIGKIQFDRKSCENIIFKEREKINIHERIDDFLFRRLNGNYYVVVVESNKLSIFLGYSTHQLYIWNQRNKDDWKIVFSDNENYIQNKKRAYDNLELATASNISFYMPRGYFLSSDDFILPGMKMSIDKKNGKYSQSWFYPIHEMVSRNDHKNIAIKIAETLVNEFSLNRIYDNNMKTIQVSSGLDSALFLAAAEESGVDYTPINFLSAGQVDEKHGAYTISKFFGKDIKFLNRDLTDNEKPFNNETDLSSYLNLTKDLLKISSGHIILNNINLLASYYLGYHTSFEGSNYPTQLCIKHHTNYPFIDPRNQKFDSKFKPKINSDIRFNYSEKHAEHRLSSFVLNEKEDNWKIGINWPEIHPFYWSYLGYCFTQTPQNTFSLSSSMFPYLSLNKEETFIKNSVINNGNEIISKMLMDKTFKRELCSPNPIVATKLTRFISFIINGIRGNNKTIDFSKSNLLNQLRPGISSQMLRILHSVRFDDVMTNYPKWHLFEAFKLLSGKDFFKINKMTPYKKLAALIKNKIIAKPKSKHYSIIRNHSVNRFCLTHNIDDKFNSFINLSSPYVQKNVSEFEKLISVSEEANFWYLNKKMNIVFMLSDDI